MAMPCDRSGRVRQTCCRFGRIISKSLSEKSPNHLINSAMYSSTLWLGMMRPRLSVLNCPPDRKSAGLR